MNMIQYQIHPIYKPDVLAKFREILGRRI